MATARDQLITDTLKLLQKAFTTHGNTTLSGILDRYRIQAKSSKVLSEGQTARESLAGEILDIWKEKKTTSKNLAPIIGHYRMQLKQSIKAEEDPVTLSKKLSAKDPSAKKGSRKQSAGSKQDAAPKKKFISQPLAGGPVKRSRERGQCPKCHSMGVVLAYSFSGEEYFSCIYCGHQSYRASADAELDLPLAAELLGRRFDDQEDVPVPDDQ